MSLIDADSYQFLNFPCPVGRPEFTAAEVGDMNFKEFLRNQGHDRFALAVMIFMILFPNQHPFRSRGGGTFTDNIKRGIFPYTQSSDSIPLGAGKNIWSYLPTPIQKLFNRSFTALPAHRPTSDQWHEALKTYQDELDSSKLCDGLPNPPSSSAPRQ